MLQRNCLHLQPTLYYLYQKIINNYSYTDRSTLLPTINRPPPKNTTIYTSRNQYRSNNYMKCNTFSAFPTCKVPSINSNDILIFGGRELLGEDRLWEDRVCRYLFLLVPLYLLIYDGINVS